jgi:hypothetical protein
MGWGIALVVAIAGVLAWTMVLNANPARCPLCHRVNIFRRSRTGAWRDERDQEGEIRRSSAEFVCGRCGGRFWIVSDDFAGRHAVDSLSPDSTA